MEDESEYEYKQVCLVSLQTYQTLKIGAELLDNDGAAWKVESANCGGPGRYTRHRFIDPRGQVQNLYHDGKYLRYLNDGIIAGAFAIRVKKLKPFHKSIVASLLFQIQEYYNNNKPPVGLQISPLAIFSKVLIVHKQIIMETDIPEDKLKGLANSLDIIAEGFIYRCRQNQAPDSQIMAIWQIFSEIVSDLRARQVAR